MRNKDLKNIILKEIVDKCEFCSSSKIVCGEKFIIDTYYSIQDIKLVLDDIFTNNKLKPLGKRRSWKK